jgi:hypothetical protein
MHNGIHLALKGKSIICPAGSHPIGETCGRMTYEGVRERSRQEMVSAPFFMPTHRGGEAHDVTGMRKEKVGAQG